MEQTYCIVFNNMRQGRVHPTSASETFHWVVLYTFRRDRRTLSFLAENNINNPGLSSLRLTVEKLSIVRVIEPFRHGRDLAALGLLSQHIVRKLFPSNFLTILKLYNNQMQ
jgi:hypothetical protein